METSTSSSDIPTPAAASTRATFRPLWQKLAVWTSLFALIPTLSIGLTLLNSNAQMIKVVSREVRLSAAEAVSVPLETLVSGALLELVGLGQALSDATLPPDVKLATLRTLISSGQALDHAVIYDARGEWIDTIQQQDLAIQPPHEPLTQAQRDLLNEQPALFSETLWEKRALIIVPVRAASGQITGYVASHIPLQPIVARLAQVVDERLSSDPGALVVLNARGETLMAADRSETRLAPALVKRAVELRALPGVATSEELQLGDEVALVTFKPLNALPWIVVASMPRSQAYAPLFRMRLIVAFAILAAALLSTLFALLFSRQITRPIDALVTQCRALAMRQFDQRVIIAERNELGLLADTLNDSAQQLADSEEELRRQERIRHDLGRYLPREVVERIVSDDSLQALAGRRAQITVLFADVVGFTELCHALSPEQTVALLNELFTIVTEIIFRHGGVVDKFIGDCVMAFWGAPEAAEHHAVDACSAAEEILSWLTLGNAAWKERYGVTLELAIGVHTGEAVVGNVGSATRMTFTAIGDTVNLAARLEAIARPGQILTTRTTATLIEELFEVVHIGSRQMPGEEEPIDLFEVRT